VTSLVIGLITGMIVAFLGVHPILVTLGTMTAVKGIAVYATNGGVIGGFPPVILFFGNGTLLGIPVPMILFVLCAVLAAVLGGVDPNGGFGKVLGLFLSLILLQIIATGFNLLGFSEFLTQFPKGSDVAIIEGDPGTTSSMERVTGFTNAAKEGGLNIVASQPANWNRRLPHERDSLLTSGRCRSNLTFPHSQRHMCQYSSLTFVPRGTIISHRPNFLPSTIC
jgi:hypothetical protein